MKSVGMLVSEGWDELLGAMNRMAAESENLKYVPNPGNAGDALIAAGAWQLFDDLSIRPTSIRTPQILTGDSVMYGGGGALVDQYSQCANFLQRCLDAGVKSALVLPQSVRGHEALLRRLDERFTIGVRDTQSFARLKEVGTGARIIQAPDLALRLNVKRLFARCKKPGVQARFFARLALRGKLPAYFKWRLAIHKLGSSNSPCFRIIRVDAESVASLKGDPRWDISAKYLSGYRTREESDFISRDFLAFLGRGESVTTNRLHAAIGAALMGRDTTMLDNSYGKIRAVYETSLSQLPHVRYSSS